MKEDTKKGMDLRTLNYLKIQVEQGVRLEDALRKIYYIKMSEALKLADRKEEARRQG